MEYTSKLSTSTFPTYKTSQHASTTGIPQLPPCATAKDTVCRAMGGTVHAGMSDAGAPHVPRSTSLPSQTLLFTTKSWWQPYVEQVHQRHFPNRLRWWLASVSNEVFFNWGVQCFKHSATAHLTNCSTVKTILYALEKQTSMALFAEMLLCCGGGEMNPQ